MDFEGRWLVAGLGVLIGRLHEVGLNVRRDADGGFMVYPTVILEGRDLVATTESIEPTPREPRGMTLPELQAYVSVLEEMEADSPLVVEVGGMADAEADDEEQREAAAALEEALEAWESEKGVAA